MGKSRVYGDGAVNRRAVLDRLNAKLVCKIVPSFE